MGAVHDLILREGYDTARLQANTPEDRRIIDLAARMLAEESEELGITYSGFCMTSLPHSKLPDTEKWERHAGRFHLLVEPGSLFIRGQRKDYGVPYGSRARLILLYLQTKAVQNNSRQVEIGRSLRDWMSRMGISDGGQAYNDVREQCRRLSACHLTFGWEDKHGNHDGFEKDNIIKSGILFRERREDERQGTLWNETVTLGETFFAALKQHPVPIREPAIKQIKNQSLTIDVYIWLAYRLHALDKPTLVPWNKLHTQFGNTYKNLFQFRPRFMTALKTALAVYPEAVVKEGKEGIQLHPSPPPIPERKLYAIR